MNGQHALAVTLTDPGDTPLWEPGVGETPLWNEVVVTGLFASGTDPAAILDVLSLLPGVRNARTQELADQAWERAWLDRFGPMQFGANFWIVPTGLECPDASADILRLDPGLAFGTGTHATTRLCLEWIAATELAGKTVLDYGCGSGVLGIAAAIRGAERVICQDNDPQAITATRDNARRNSVQDKVEAVMAERPAGLEADIVISNILASVLVDLAGDLQARVCRGGTLALTGILTEQAEQVAAAYAERFPRLERSTIDDWVLLTGTEGGG
jgi:ribosomal protein L11 methyltransferase